MMNVRDVDGGYEMPEGIISCYNDKCEHFDPEMSDNCGRTIKRIQSCLRAIIKKGGKAKNFYYDQLQGNECACDGPKRRGYSFCFTCYKHLPKDMQSDLYQKIGQGYEEAYDEAVKWLEVNVW